ncbi:DUF6979 family protein [Clostridium estertheticum]|uniref:DUF6979 family protein n=1 Tax=Clostridium estertheticum TaxID=238834 RepID=UPI0037C17200
MFDGNVSEPREARKIVSIGLFGEGTSSQRKKCPKSYFLGLCEEGLAEDKAYNGQRDIVLGIWENGMILK